MSHPCIDGSCEHASDTGCKHALAAELEAPPAVVDARVDLPARLCRWLWNQGLSYESSITIKQYSGPGYTFAVNGQRNVTDLTETGSREHFDDALRNFLNDVRTNDAQ